MNSNKKHYTPEFKLHAVLESFQRDRTCRDVCRHAGISPSMLRGFRQTFLERAPTIFQPPPDLRSPAQPPGYAPGESHEELKRIIADLLVQQDRLKRTGEPLRW
jgi:transposase-like protein